MKHLITKIEFCFSILCKNSKNKNFRQTNQMITHLTEIHVSKTRYIMRVNFFQHTSIFFLKTV